MVSDDNKKSPPANIFGLEDEAWDDAIDDWGDQLPLETPASPVVATKSVSAPDRAPTREVFGSAKEVGRGSDAVAEWAGDEEFEFEDSAGAALGALLGSDASDEKIGEEPGFFDEDAITSGGALVDAGLEVEVEVDAGLEVEVDAGLEIEVDAGLEVEVVEADIVEAPTAGSDVLEPLPGTTFEDEPPELPQDFEEEQREPVARAQDAPHARAKLSMGIPHTLPLSAIDDLVPMPLEADVQAGEVLPAPTPMALPASAPSIFDEIDIEKEEVQTLQSKVPDPGLMELSFDETSFAAGSEAPAFQEPELWLGALDGATKDADSTRKAAHLAVCAAHVAEAGGRPDEALERFKDVLNHQAGHVIALQALQRLYVEREEHKEGATILSQLTEVLSGDLGQRLRLQLADHLWLGGDDEGARAALAESPLALRSSLLLVDLSMEGDTKAQAEALRRLAASLEGEGRLAAAVHITRGRLLEREGDMHGAASAYGVAAEADDACRAAWEGLARAARSLGDHQAHAKALESGSSLLGSWQGRVLRRRAVLMAHGLVEGDARAEFERSRELDERSELTILGDLCEFYREHPAREGIDAHLEMADGLEEKSEKALALTSAGSLAEAAGDVERAGEIYRRALEVDPDSLMAKHAATRLIGDDADPERKVTAYQQAAGATQGAQAAAFHLQAASVCRRALKDVPRAVDEYRAALRADPGSAVAFGGISAALGSSDQGELAKILREVAHGAEDGSRAAALACSAAGIEEQRGETDEAITALELAVARDSAMWLARCRLSRLLAQHGRHEALASLLEGDLESAEASRQALLSTRYAELKALGEDWDEAARAYDRASADDAAADRARWGVIRLAARAEAWPEVARNIEQMCALRGAEDTARQEQALLLRLAALRAGPLEDLQGAAEALERASAGPDAPEGATAALGRVEGWIGDAGHVGKDLRQRLETCSVEQERRALLIALAEAAKEEGATQEQVVEQLQSPEEIDAKDPVVSLVLQEAFLELGQWEEFEEAVLTQVSSVEQSSLCRALYDDLAGLAMLRGDADAAKGWFAKLLALQPHAVDALRSQQQALASEGHSEELLPLGEQEAKSAESAMDRFSLFCGLGRQLSRSKTRSRPGETITTGEAWSQALEASPSSHLAGRSLVEARLGQEEPQLLADVYLRCADASSDPVSAASWRMAAAEALGADGTDGTTRLAAALEVVPGDLAAIYEWRDRELLAERWETALVATEAAGKVLRAPVGRVHAQLLAGVISAEKLQQADDAAAHFQAALEVNPAHRPAFERLRKILEEGERWVELVQALKTRLMGVTGDGEEAGALHQRIAEVAQERLDDWPLAQKHLEAFLTISPEDGEALEAMATVYEHEELWTQAAEALIRRARLEGCRDKLRDYLLRLGRIYQDKEPDHQRAILSFNKVLTLDATNMEALQRLSDLYMDDLQFEPALGATEQLLMLEHDPERQVDHLLRIGKLYEDGLKDEHRAAQALRRANELAPADLRAIGALCGFYARQGDQRSVMIHLDRAQTSMRARLEQDAFEEFAYRALFKIFGWRKNPDGRLCAAEVLQLLGHLNPEERQFVERHASGVGAPGSALAADEHDEWLFCQEIPSGFRHLFRLLAEPLSRLRRGDLRGHGVGRGDRLDSKHPVRGIGDQVARDLGVSSYELFISQTEPHAVVVENTSPPAVILGKVLIEGASEQEVTFLLGRCLWIIRKAMVLPARFPEDVEALVAGVVRQYVPEFEPAGTDARLLTEVTKQVSRVIPRKMKQELMPFALECSGEAEAIGGLGPAVIHSANRAGLLACRSVEGAINALRKAAGQGESPRTKEQRTSMLLDNPEAEELMRFAISDAHFELRRAMNIAIR
ncbi:MAG: hypothetical protein JRH20_02100 [Deltaproteobacteria bacterium]|nr:hypothetical protein [Deltaproteobacteria bacterium]